MKKAFRRRIEEFLKPHYKKKEVRKSGFSVLCVHALWIGVRTTY